MRRFEPNVDIKPHATAFSWSESPEWKLEKGRHFMLLGLTMVESIRRGSRNTSGVSVSDIL